MSKEYLNWLGEPLEPRKIKIFDGNYKGEHKCLTAYECIRECIPSYGVPNCKIKCNGGFGYDGCNNFMFKQHTCVITV